MRAARAQDLFWGGSRRFSGRGGMEYVSRRSCTAYDRFFLRTAGTQANGHTRHVYFYSRSAAELRQQRGTPRWIVAPGGQFICIFSKNILTTLCAGGIIFGRPYEAVTPFGGIAQLGERLNGIQEVSGSIPLISTKKHSIS